MSTGISWTDETWNPTVGCSKISEGCRNCYAIGQSHRNAAIGETMPNPGRLKYYEGLTEKRGDRVDWTGAVNFVPEALEIPLKWRKPRRIFVNSMSDLFHESVPFDWIDQVFAVMALTPQHTYQILTKRPDRMLEYLSTSERLGIILLSARAEKSLIPGGMYPLAPFWPLPNVWLGVTVENQQAANDRIPLLLQCPAAVRFLSCEPLLEEIDLTDIVSGDAGKVGGEWHFNSLSLEEYGGSLIDWAIVGGESGHNARPCRIEWIRSIVNQCQKAEVPVFVKQLGAKPYQVYDRILGKTITWPISDRKGAIVAEFPDYLQVQQFPQTP